MDRVNDAPITFVDGRTDYEYVYPLPTEWRSLWFRVMAITQDGDSFLVGERGFANPVPMVDDLRIFPNPSTGTFTLELTTKEADDIRVEIFDCGGRLVRALADARFPAGRSTFEWDGRDGAGHPVAVGIHYARVTMRSAETRQYQKLIVLR